MQIEIVYCKHGAYRVGEAVEGGGVEHGERTVSGRVDRLQTDDVIDQVLLVLLQRRRETHVQNTSVKHKFRNRNWDEPQQKQDRR